MKRNFVVLLVCIPLGLGFAFGVAALMAGTPKPERTVLIRPDGTICPPETGSKPTVIYSTGATGAKAP